MKHIAKVINNNQPGWTNIVETEPHVTLDVGTKLYLKKDESEYGWLVEGEENGLAVWMCLSCGVIFWSSDPNLALRFCRVEDASAMARFLCGKLPGNTLGGLRITDHLWTGRKRNS